MSVRNKAIDSSGYKHKKHVRLKQIYFLFFTLENTEGTRLISEIKQVHVYLIHIYTQSMGSQSDMTE